MKNMDKIVKTDLGDISMDIFLTGMYSHTRLDSYSPLTRGVADEVKPTNRSITRLIRIISWV